MTMIGGPKMHRGAHDAKRLAHHGGFDVVVGGSVEVLVDAGGMLVFVTGGGWVVVVRGCGGGMVVVVAVAGGGAAGIGGKVVSVGTVPVVSSAIGFPN